MNSPFILSPLNFLIQKSQISDRYSQFIKELIQYIVKNPSSLRLFISNESSPLLHQYIQLIATDKAPTCDLLLLLIIESKKDSQLLAFQSFNSLILASIDFASRSIDQLTNGKQQVLFLQTLDYSMISSPQELSNTFLSLFRDKTIYF